MDTFDKCLLALCVVLLACIFGTISYDIYGKTKIMEAAITTKADPLTICILKH